jgi:transcriptional regulator with GAF, ATPase, and Fis domain
VRGLEGELRAQALPIVGEAAAGLFTVEARAIEEALRCTSGNVAAAARRLGVGPDRVRPHVRRRG